MKNCFHKDFYSSSDVASAFITDASSNETARLRLPETITNKTCAVTFVTEISHLSC